MTNKNNNKPSYPEFGYIDGDAILFAAASAGEQVWYVYVDKDGNEVARFDEAAKGKSWVEMSKEFGCDVEFDYEGDFDDLIRETHYEVKDFSVCKKTFKSMIKQWVKQAKVDDYVVYISKSDGAENFRYKLATIEPYKKGRKDLRKPYYLEELRKWVFTQDKVRKGTGKVEVDDYVCAGAQKRGKKGCVIAVDKDCRQVSGCFFMVPEENEKPVFSNPKIVGRIGLNTKGKMIGFGNLFLLSQVLTGDTADTYSGCKKVGMKKAHDVLKPYHNAKIDQLENVIRDCCEIFESTYGYNYEYTNHHTDEKLTVSWKEIMIENLKLAYMLKNKKVNIAIVLSSIVIFSVSLFLLRSQRFVDDVDYMEAMIPHHSIAILTSERAQISDPRVRELADEIIDAQLREIDEMKQLIEDLE